MSSIKITASDNTNINIINSTNDTITIDIGGAPVEISPGEKVTLDKCDGSIGVTDKPIEEPPHTEDPVDPPVEEDENASNSGETTTDNGSTSTENDDTSGSGEETSSDSNSSIDEDDYGEGEAV